MRIFNIREGVATFGYIKAPPLVQYVFSLADCNLFVYKQVTRQLKVSTRVKMDREQSLLFNLYSMRLLAGFFLTDGEMTSKQKSQYHSSNFTFLMFCLVLLEVNISYFSLNNDDSTYWRHRIINFNRPNIVSQLQNSFPVILRI